MYLSFSRIIIISCLLTACQTNLATKDDKTKSLTIDHLIFSPDSHSLAYTVFPSIKDEVTVGLWRLKSGKVINTTKKMNHKIETIFFSPDGKNLALMYRNWPKTNYGFIWNIDRNEFSEKQSYMPDYLGSDSIVVASPDNKFTAQPDRMGRIRLWNNATKKIIKTYQFEHIKTIYAIQFTPDSKRLVIIGRYSSPYHYNSTEKNKYEGPTLIVSFDLSDKNENIVLDTKSTFLNFQKKSHRLLTSTKKTVEIWDSFKQTLIQKIKFIGNIKHIQLSNDGRFMAAIIHSDLIILPSDKPIEMENRSVVVIWDIKTGLPFHVLTDGTNSTTSLAISSDSKALATGDNKAVIRLWNIKTGEMIKQLTVQSLK